VSKEDREKREKEEKGRGMKEEEGREEERTYSIPHPPDAPPAIDARIQHRSGMQAKGDNPEGRTNNCRDGHDVKFLYFFEFLVVSEFCHAGVHADEALRRGKGGEGGSG
jgi:hypothetical protein